MIFLLKNASKVLLSLFFILLISRIDKSPLDTLSAARIVHTSIEISYLERSSKTVDMSLFLTPFYFDLFLTQTFTLKELKS